MVDGILRNAQVVLSTLNGSSSHAIEKCVQFCGLFDTILIDEATQALEAECWIAITKGKKLILAGDHLQLPPTVKSLDSKTIKTAIKKPKKTTSSATSSSAEVINNSSDEGMLTLPDSLEFTLFDRLLQLHGKKIKRLLNVQYRANEIIMKYSSKSLYDGELVSHDSVKDRLLVDLKDVKETEDTIAPLVFIDTSGCQLYESTEEENTFSSQLVSSKLNEGEAQLVVEHVHKLIKGKFLKQHADLPLISFYIL